MTAPFSPEPTPDPTKSADSRRRRQNMLDALDRLSSTIAGGERTPLGDLGVDTGVITGGAQAADPDLVGDQPLSISAPDDSPPDLVQELEGAGLGAPSGSELRDTSGLPSHAEVVNEAQGLLNGRIPKDKLEVIMGAHPGYRAGFLLPTAAKAWNAMIQAAATDGVRLYHSDTYRSWETQNAAYAKYRRGERGPGIIVAPPGTSKHGAGLAVDVTDGGGILSKGTAQWQWLSQNAARFGWYGISSEAWHWEYRGT